MANLEKLAANYRSEGYSALLAEARVFACLMFYKIR